MLRPKAHGNIIHFSSSRDSNLYFIRPSHKKQLHKGYAVWLNRVILSWMILERIDTTELKLK